jgi:hypothetical protein
MGLKGFDARTHRSFFKSFSGKKPSKNLYPLGLSALDTRGKPPSTSKQFLYCILRVQQSKILL